VNLRRIGRFKERIQLALESGAASSYRGVVEDFARESGADVVDVAAALASLAQGKTPLILGGKRAQEDTGAAPMREAKGREDRTGSIRPATRADGSGRRKPIGWKWAARTACSRAHRRCARQ